MYIPVADIDEQDLQMTVGSGSKLHGMTDLFEDVHLFCTY